MSKRVWIDTENGGYGRPQPFHRVQPKPDPVKGIESHACTACGQGWYWAKKPASRYSKAGFVRRHYPGTFWQDDSDRSRW